MALSTSLGLARKVLKKVHLVESEQVPDQWKMLVPRVESTTQSKELYKQLAGYGPAERTDEGEEVHFDNQFPLYTLTLEPYMVTKGTRYSRLKQFTEQYKEVTKVVPQWARAFKHKRNQVAADMYNNGFSSGYGVNSEALFATSHAMGVGGVTFANRPSVDVAFGPDALKQAAIEVRKQKSARNTIQPALGKLRIIHPVDLEPSVITVCNSLQLAGVANNDTNKFIRERYSYFTCDYLTSTTAWFLISEDQSEHGLVWLNQMPYDIEQLPRDTKLMDAWVASESYNLGWYDAHGTWGTTG
jgi:hypothetical protein